MQKTILIIIIVIVNSVSLFSITLDDYLELVKTNNPFIQERELEVEIKKQDVITAKGKEYWTLNNELSYSYQEPVDYGMEAVKRINSADLSTEISRTFWKTGGSLSFKMTNNYLNSREKSLNMTTYENETNNNDFGTNKFQIIYTHPLLKNFRGNLNRLEAELSEYEISSAQFQGNREIEEMLLKNTEAFLDWVLLDEKRKIAAEQTAIYENQLLEIKKMYDANLIDRIDLIRAENAVNSSKENELWIGMEWESQKSILEIQTGTILKKPEFDLHKNNTLLKYEDLLNKMLENSRVIKELKIRKEQLLHLKKGYEDMSKPELNLFVSASLQDGDKKFIDAIILEKKDVSAGLMFSVPLGNYENKSKITRTSLQIKKLDFTLKNIERELNSALTPLLVQIKELEKILKLNNTQLELSKAKFKEEQNKYFNGNNELIFVIQSRNDIQDAQLSQVQNLIVYQKLFYQLKSLTDKLYDTN